MEKIFKYVANDLYAQGYYADRFGDSSIKSVGGVNSTMLSAGEQ